MKSMIFVLFVSSTLYTHAQTPLLNAHAHNDYEHDRPLFEALENGFISVEVDVHLINGELYVSHDEPTDLSKTRTLGDLYLKPLMDHIKRNEGRVHKSYDDYFYLMVDVKTQAESSYPVLRSLLEKYKSMLSVVSGKEDQKGKPVKVFISGFHGRPYKQILSDKVKYAGIDGRPDELNEEVPSAYMPVISDNYNNHFSWKGTGEVDGKELYKVTKLISEAHRQGKKVRFWAAPDYPEVWDFLLSIGVDLINTDRLADFREFMQEKND